MRQFSPLMDVPPASPIEPRRGPEDFGLAVGLAGRAHVGLCRDNRRWAAGEDASGTVPQVVFEAIGFAFHWHAEMRHATESVGKRRTWILGRFGRGLHAFK